MDLSQIQTTARRDEDDTWRLYGRKWFTSSTAANMSLVLARTNEDEAESLTLFYVPIRETNDEAPSDGIHVNRVKDKMGARKLPVSGIEIDGAVARLVSTIGEGAAPRPWSSTSLRRRSTTLRPASTTRRTHWPTTPPTGRSLARPALPQRRHQGAISLETKAS